MNERASWIVGLTVLAAAALLAWVTVVLQGGWGKTYTASVRFLNAQGLQAGAPVRVRGVEMGSVEEIGLDGEQIPVARLKMSRAYRLRPGDRVKVVGSLLSLNPPYVEVTPGGGKAVDGPVVLEGDSGADPSQLTEQAGSLVKNLDGLVVKMTDLTESLTEIAGDRSMQNNLRSTAANFSRLSESGLRTARNLESATGGLGQLVDVYARTGRRLEKAAGEASGAMSTFRSTGVQATELMKDSRAMMQEARQVVGGSGELVASTRQAVEKMSDLLTDTRGLLFKEAQPRLVSVLDRLDASLKQLEGALTDTRNLIGDTQLQADLKATAANLRSASANLDRIGADVRSLTGDPKIQEDLRASIGSLRDLTARADRVLERAGQVLGTGGRAARSLGSRLARTSLSVDVLQGFNGGARLDLAATLPWTESGFYRAGLRSVGEGNRLTLQAGRRLNPALAARYGFYASRLGLGLDAGKPGRASISLDLYGLHNPRADARLNLPLRSGLDLTLGADRLLGNPNPIVGLRYRR